MDKCIEGIIRNKPYVKEAILIFGEAGPEFTNREFMQKHPEFNEIIRLMSLLSRYGIIKRIRKDVKLKRTFYKMTDFGMHIYRLLKERKQ